MEDISGDVNVQTRFRLMVHDYMNKEMFTTAIFWAEKVVCLSKVADTGYYDDVMRLSLCLYKSKQYHRAINVLQKNQCMTVHECAAHARYIAALSYRELGDYTSALDLIGECDDKLCDVITSLFGSTTSPQHTHQQFQNKNKKILSAICVLRGELHEVKDNKVAASDSYKAALEYDVYCFTALDSLLQNHMLKSDEELELYKSLRFEDQCSADDIDMVKMLYKNRLKSVMLCREREAKHINIVINSDNIPSELEESTDLLITRAERFYYTSRTLDSYKVCKLILDRDYLNPHCLLVYIACLFELKKNTELFKLGHNLVHAYPDAPVSWYAVGCYYMLSGKMESARRYFTKSTNLNASFAPAWLAYAHSFGYDNEHDQAVAAYFKAIQHLRGCHLAYLYIGVEYTLTHSIKLAVKFMDVAMELAGMDPLVMHEHALIKYQLGNLGQALALFKSVLTQISDDEECDMSEKVKWEPVINNIAHCYRKMGNYDLALEYHIKALSLIPHNPSTLCAIGFVHALNANFLQAIEYFEATLSVQRDDTFAANMLSRCLEVQVVASLPEDELEVVRLPPVSEVVHVVKQSGSGAGAVYTELSGDTAGVVGDRLRALTAHVAAQAVPGAWVGTGAPHLDNANHEDMDT